MAVVVAISMYVLGCGGGGGGTGGGGGGGAASLPPGFVFHGFALVSRPEGASSLTNGTDITLVTGLNTGAPAVNPTPIQTSLASVDTLALSDDATVGIADGENQLAVLQGLDTGSPTVSTPIIAPDGSSASGVMVRNDDATALLAGTDGVHIVSGLAAAPTVPAPVIGAALAGGFRTLNDAMAYAQDTAHNKKIAVIGSAGKGFSTGNTSDLQVITAADTASPVAGPHMTLPAANSGYEGHAGMCFSPADGTRMTVPVGTGFVLITGLDTGTPTVGSIVTFPNLAIGDTVINTAISRDGKRVAVLTQTGVMVFTGVNTGSFAAATPFLSLDSGGIREYGNLGIAMALDNSALFVSNDDTGALYVITGFGGASLTLSSTLTLLPSEPGRQDDDALLLH